MTDYDKSKMKSNKSRPKYRGLDYSFLYQPDEIIDKYNNHISPKVPNFDYMTSRPTKKNSPLPPFMQNVHDRKSMEIITEKSLKLNNYPNGKFLTPSSSFLPKKSFNNIINLNVLNSENLKGKNLKDEFYENQREELRSSLNFFHKNYDELIKEGALSKFDNITLKTNQRRKIDPGDIDKFVINFDNVDT
jgi:hypothetical protein